MTLPDPLRGYAAPTWDTRTLKTLIDAMGGPGAASPPGQAANDARYAMSPLQTWLDVENGDGVGTITTLPNTSWITINVAGTVWANPGGGFDPATDIYTVPLAGTYLCRALMRIADGFGVSTNVGMGIGTSNVDGSWFQWNKYVTGGGGRCALDYLRIAGFSAGAPLRLYAWQESGGNMNITRASLQVWRLCG